MSLLEVEESLVPVEVEAEVLPLAPLLLSVGQEGGALPGSARLLEVVGESVVGPVIQGLVVQSQSPAQLTSLGETVKGRFHLENDHFPHALVH